MKSISQAQLNPNLSRLIDLNSYDPAAYTEFKGDAVMTALYNIAAEFIKNASNNLQQVDRISTGALLDSINPSEITIMGKTYSISINVNDYYKFIDKGVKGWKSGSPSDSPYAFKQPGKRGEAPKSSKMVSAIRQWLIKEGLKATTSTGKSITKRESKRKSITDASTKAAIVVAQSIKKKGLDKTNFWTKAGQQTTNYAEKEIGIALQIDIINSL